MKCLQNQAMNAANHEHVHEKHFHLQILFLDNNELTGPLKGSVFGSMPHLHALYVHHNRLTGPIEASLGEHNELDTLFIQGNDFNGNWPESFCPGSCDGYSGKCAHNLVHFGLECRKNYCSHACCLKKHCFHP